MQAGITRRSLVWGAGLVGLVATTEALPRVAGAPPQKMADLGVPGLTKVGVATGEERRAGHEALLLPDGREVRRGPESPALQLIPQVRDGAHRFAITGHRGRRRTVRASSRLGEIPGADTLDPKNDPIPVKGNPPPKADPTVKNDPTPRTPKEKGEVTLVLIPDATVMKGGTVLGKGTMVTFSLNVGTHLVTVTGGDGVRRALSLQVGAGKNKPQKYRLDDLPPQ